ncbi:MAG: Type secretion system protein N-terminal domain [Pseudomonadota bacterium]|jgi:hypothetical protein
MESVKALLERGILSPDQKTMVDGFCKRWNCSGFEALIETHMVQEVQFADHAAEILGLPRLRNLKQRKLLSNPGQLIPLPFARRKMAIVVDVIDPGPATLNQRRVFKVAVANPWDPHMINSLEEMLDGDIEYAVADRSDILDAIDRNYPFSDFVPEFWRSMCSVTAD